MAAPCPSTERTRPAFGGGTTPRSKRTAHTPEGRCCCNFGSLLAEGVTASSQALCCSEPRVGHSLFKRSPWFSLSGKPTQRTVDSLYTWYSYIAVPLCDMVERLPVVAMLAQDEEASPPPIVRTDPSTSSRTHHKQHLPCQPLYLLHLSSALAALPVH